MNINLEEILQKHQRWLAKSPGWSESDRAVLCRMDLSYQDLSGVNLYGADLAGTNFFQSNLSRAILTGADMTSSILSGTILTDAKLRNTNLLNTNMYRAEVSGADFYHSNLFEANVAAVNIAYAVNFPNIPFACPGTGSFVGWKKAITDDKTPVIVELEILPAAKRSSATGRKCRCSAAKVLSIKSVDYATDYTTAKGTHDDTFTYTLGQTVTSAFDEDRWNECSDGIHFYMTRDEAINYKIPGEKI